MTSQNSSISGRPVTTAQRPSGGGGALFLKILGIVVGLGALAYLGLCMAIASAFQNFQY
jgi:hypothetical protein